MFEQIEEFELDEFEADWAEMELRHMLRCVDKHCPDLLFRASACRQMRKNGWEKWGGPEIELKPLLRRI
jgi:hypothetical protein